MVYRLGCRIDNIYFLKNISNTKYFRVRISYIRTLLKYFFFFLYNIQSRTKIRNKIAKIIGIDNKGFQTQTEKV